MNQNTLNMIANCNVSALYDEGVLVPRSVGDYKIRRPDRFSPSERKLLASYGDCFVVKVNNERRRYELSLFNFFSGENKLLTVSHKAGQLVADYFITKVTEMDFINSTECLVRKDCATLLICDGTSITKFEENALLTDLIFLYKDVGVRYTDPYVTYLSASLDQENRFNEKLSKLEIDVADLPICTLTRRRIKKLCDILGSNYKAWSIEKPEKHINFNLTLLERSVLIKRIHEAIHELYMDRVLINKKTVTFLIKNIHLTKKLEDYIYNNYLKNYPPEDDVYNVVFQGEETTSVQPKEHNNIDQGGNVVLMDDGAISSPQILPPKVGVTLSKEGMTKEIANELTDRYMLMKSYSWTASNLKGSNIVDLKLPKDLLGLGNVSYSPNTSFFDSYMYLHFDMRIQIRLNANRFQVGQLQASWTYNMPYMRNELYDNIYSASQRPMALITAPSNNVAELFIPYRFVYPYGINIGDQLKWCTMQIKVLNELVTTSASFKSANLSIFFKFENIRVHGMRSKGTISFQGIEQILINSAEAALKQAWKDFNRDNPSNSQNFEALVPYGSHSWCIGTNQVERTNILRLDPTATTPHFDETYDEMRVDYITRIFGYLGTIQWDSSKNSGDDLGSALRINPNLLHATSIIDSITAAELPTRGSPPIAVISSMFAYWRGSIEFKFDIISTFLHTGRLQVSFVPGPYKSSTMSQAACSYSAIFDLSDQTSFTFIVPYISDQTWMNVYPRDNKDYAQNPVLGTGVLQVHVLNPLIPMDNVPKKIDINIYVRAGVDFKLAVPVNCVITPGFDRYYLKDYETITLLNGYYPIYAGNWRYFKQDTTFKYIMRYGEVTDHVAQAKGGHFHAVYQPVYGSRLAKMKVNGQLVDIHYYVIPKIKDQESYSYLVPFQMKQQAIDFAEAGAKKADGYSDISKAITWEENGEEAVYSNNVTLIQVYWAKKTSVIKCQGDDKTDDVQSVNLIPVSDIDSKMFFQEDFNDLKNLCRRYQLYSDAGIRLSKNTCFSQVFYRLPVNPSGIDMLQHGSTCVAEVFNRIREGAIPTLASGFRFFKGGLRFRFIVRASDGTDIVLSITHVPELSSKNVPETVYPKNFADYSGTGYAAYGQCTRVNEMYEIEIPYYLNSDLGMLSRASALTLGKYEQTANLGYLNFALASRLEKDTFITIQGYYAFADDMRFSSFQGFPKMITFLDIPAEESLDDDLEELSASEAYFQGEEEEVIEHQMFGYFKNKCSEAVSSGTNIIASEVEKKISPAFNATKEYGREVIEKITTMLASTVDILGDNLKRLGGLVLSQLVMLYNSPTWFNASVSVFGILSCLKFFDPMKILMFSSLFATIMTTLEKKRELDLKQASLMFDMVKEKAKHQERIRTYEQGHACGAIGFQGVEENINKLNKEVITAICEKLGLSFQGKEKVFSKAPNMFKYVLSNMKEFAMTANSISMFLRLHMDGIKQVLVWLMKKINPEFGFCNMVVSQSDEINKWATKVQTLTSPIHKVEILRTPTLQREVFKCAIEARKISMMTQSSPDASPIHREVCNLSNRIIKLQDELASSCLSPSVRYEPFVIQFAGEPGIGKSFLCQKIGYDFMKSINYKTTEEVIYTRTAGNAYWNKVGNQPIVLYDDFGFKDGDNFLDSQIGELFQLKSSSVFNPPIAEIENKKFRYNPLMVFLASNQAYVKCSGVNDIKALYRRRDMLWHVELKDEYKQSAKGKTAAVINKDILKKYGHLQFRRYIDVTDPESGKSDPIEFEEFIKICMSEFKKYHLRELDNYKTRLNLLSELAPDDIFEDGDWLAKLHKDEINITNNDLKTFLINVRNKVDSTIISPQGREVFKDAKEHLDRNVRIADTCPHSTLLMDLDWYYEANEDKEKCVFSRFDNYDIQVSANPCGEKCALFSSKGTKWCENMIDRHFKELIKSQQALYHQNQVPFFVLPQMDNGIYYETTESLIPTEQQGNWVSKIKEKYNKFSETKLGQMFNTFLKISGWLLKATGMVLAMFGGYTLFKHLRQGSEERMVTEDPWEVNGQYSASGDNNIIGKNKPKHVSKMLSEQLNRVKYAKPQFKTENPSEILARLIHKNMALVKVESNQKVYSNKILGICSKYAIVTKHFLETVRGYKSPTIRFIRGSANITLKMNDMQVSELKESSLAILKLPNCIPDFSDLTKHFLCESDFERFSLECTFYEYKEDYVTVTPVYAKLKSSLYVKGNEHVEDQKLNAVFAYPISQAGKCGSVLVSNLPYPRIIGIHVAGTEGSSFVEGYAQPVFREQFDELKQDIIPFCEMEAEIQMLEEHSLVQPIPEGIHVVGIVPQVLAAHIPDKTKIVQSPMFDQIFPHETEPAILSRKDKRNVNAIDPFNKAIAKHGAVPIDFDQNILDRCVEQLTLDLIATTNINHECKELLSDQEIFGGIAGIEGYNPLNLKTSAGYPLAKESTCTGKGYLFPNYTETTQGKILNEIKDELKDIMNYNDKLRKRGCIPNTIFQDCLKDSRVSPKHIKDVKTRLFSVSPLEFTWVCKKYFGRFQAAYQQNRIANSTAIGINVDSSEWTRLGRMLLEKGNNIIVGDYSSFGDTLMSKCIIGVFKAINEWYKIKFSDEHTEYREILLKELLHVQHIAKNLVYRMYCGIPSGFALTVETNDLVNKLYMYYCFVKLTGRRTSEFNRYCYGCFYGDDLILSVADEVKDEFNFETIQKCLAEYNIKFTPATKDDTIYKTLPLTEVTFLKAKFVVHPIRKSYFMAQRPLASCLDTLNWKWRGNDDETTVFENARAAVWALYGQGPEVHNYWLKRIIQWFSGSPWRRQVPHLDSWYEIDRKIYEDNY